MGAVRNLLPQRRRLLLAAAAARPELPRHVLLVSVGSPVCCGGTLRLL
tara:strand:+ start:1085 stop:1228 length:144 start_codon:yes stop_codon:yes gene_type:complete